LQLSQSFHVCLDALYGPLFLHMLPTSVHHTDINKFIVLWIYSLSVNGSSWNLNPTVTEVIRKYLGLFRRFLDSVHPWLLSRNPFYALQAHKFVPHIAKLIYLCRSSEPFCKANCKQQRILLSAHLMAQDCRKWEVADLWSRNNTRSVNTECDCRGGKCANLDLHHDHVYGGLMQATKQLPATQTKQGGSTDISPLFRTNR
jgi:hypothetical protein